MEIWRSVWDNFFLYESLSDYNELHDAGIAIIGLRERIGDSAAVTPMIAV